MAQSQTPGEDASLINEFEKMDISAHLTGITRSESLAVPSITINGPMPNISNSLRDYNYRESASKYASRGIEDRPTIDETRSYPFHWVSERRVVRGLFRYLPPDLKEQQTSHQELETEEEKTRDPDNDSKEEATVQSRATGNESPKAEIEAVILALTKAYNDYIDITDQSVEDMTKLYNVLTLPSWPSEWNSVAGMPSLVTRTIPENATTKCINNWVQGFHDSYTVEQKTTIEFTSSPLESDLVEIFNNPYRLSQIIDIWRHVCKLSKAKPLVKEAAMRGDWDRLLSFAFVSTGDNLELNTAMELSVPMPRNQFVDILLGNFDATEPKQKAADEKTTESEEHSVKHEEASAQIPKTPGERFKGEYNALFSRLHLMHIKELNVVKKLTALQEILAGNTVTRTEAMERELDAKIPHVRAAKMALTTLNDIDTDRFKQAIIERTASEPRTSIFDGMLFLRVGQYDTHGRLLKASVFKDTEDGSAKMTCSYIWDRELEPSTGAYMDIPLLFTEYKRDHATEKGRIAARHQASHQCLAYAVSSLVQLESLGICRWPVFTVVIEGHKAECNVAWMTDKREILYMERNVAEFDIRKVTDLLNYIFFIARLRREGSKRLEKLLDRANLQDRRKNAKLISWTVQDQSPLLLEHMSPELRKKLVHVSKRSAAGPDSKAKTDHTSATDEIMQSDGIPTQTQATKSRKGKDKAKPDSKKDGSKRQGTSSAGKD